jgi:hypothetical protein
LQNRFVQSQNSAAQLHALSIIRLATHDTTVYHALGIVPFPVPQPLRVRA